MNLPLTLVQVRHFSKEIESREVKVYIADLPRKSVKVLATLMHRMKSEELVRVHSRSEMKSDK